MSYQSENKVCQNCSGEFIIEPDDFSFYEKMKVPPPTFCSECRRQRRLAYRNDFVFYNRECNLCHRNLISIYSKDKKQIIYCNKCWWSDKWNPKDYSMEYDFSRSFFEQFKEFRLKIPALALVNDNNIGSINSEYIQNVQYSKNCYMAMVSWKIEDCLYFSYGAHAKECVDCMGIFDSSEGLYESLYSQKSFGSKFIYYSSSILNSYFLFDCVNCSDCFMCIGLRNKKHCIKNKQYSKEEYELIIKNFNLDKFSQLEKYKKEFFDFIKIFPKRYSNFNNCVECSGNNLVNSKNAKSVFHVKKAENCKYLENGDTEKDSYDLCVGGELSECYEGLTPDNSTKALFTIYVWKSLEILYSEFCISSNNLFGCIGLKNSSYSIFNKQYEKEEYLKIKNKIIEQMIKDKEWGEFFPMKDSPFAYNETMANLSFPKTKEDCLSEGLVWQENIQETRGKTTLLDIPDSILDIKDSIINEILECQSCTRNYKIISQELLFYRKWSLPIPRECFFCRLKNRFFLRGPSSLWCRKCMKEGCNNEFETTYAPDRSEIIYCEKCYQNEVY